MKRPLLAYFFLIAILPVSGQTGGDNTYEFLKSEPLRLCDSHWRNDGLAKQKRPQPAIF